MAVVMEDKGDPHPAAAASGGSSSAGSTSAAGSSAAGPSTPSRSRIDPFPSVAAESTEMSMARQTYV
jgi:hypothetical protein